VRKSINPRVSQFSIFLGAFLTLVIGTASPAQTTPALIQFTPAEVYLVAGLNGSGYSGDNGPAIDAQLNQAEGLAYDSAGNLYIGDSYNYVVRKVDTSGIITTFAGSGNYGYSGDNLPAIDADFERVSGLAFDAVGDLYIADPRANVVRKVDTTGKITTVAGTGTAGYTGDGLAATAATLDMPWALAFDAAGNLYIADEFNQVVRIVDTTGKINTFAGTGFDHGSQNCGTFTPFTGAATSAQFCEPQGVAADGNGNVYISDSGDQVVWVVNSGNISVFAGTGAQNYSGDGGPATSATFHFPEGLVVDSGGNLYISDEGNSVIRKVDQTGTITTVFGNGAGLSKYGIGQPDTQITNLNSGPESEASFVTIDPSGNIVVASAEDATVDEAGTTGDIYFTNQPVFTTQTYYLVIANPGGQPLTFLGVPTVSAPFGISGGTCNLTGTLAAGASCTVGVTFTPTADQLYNGSFVLDTNAAASPSTVKMIGTGKGTGVTSATLLPSLLNFTSSVGVQSAPQTITLTNTGSYSLAYDGVSLEQPSSGFSETNNCPATLAPGAFCQFQVTFTPTAATTFSSGLYPDIPAFQGYYSVLDGTGTGPTATPVISPLATPTYNAPVAVEITDATPGSSILYSTDGTVPSVAYPSPFTVTTSGTQVQALANVPSSYYTTSPTASSTYTIQPYLEFAPATVGSTQQLIATFSLMGSTTPTAALHYGHDYTAGSITCTPTASTLTEVCTVPVTFVPTLPGARKDAVFLTSGGSRIATVLLYGVGQAPMGLFLSGIVTTYQPNNVAGVDSLAVDDNDTAYVATPIQGLISVTKSGTVTTLLPKTTVGSKSSVAIDGAGVLYTVAVGGAGITYDTVQGVQGTWNLPTLPGNDLWETGTVGNTGESYAISVSDSSDAPFFYAVNPDGTYQSTALPAAFEGSPYSSVEYAAAVDSSENVFAGGGPNLYEIVPPTTVPSSTINAGGSSTGLGVDAADTVYQTLPNGTGVELLPTSSYGTAVSTISPANLSNPGNSVAILGVSVGPDGTVFLTDTNGLQLINRSQSPTIDFGTVNAHTTSVAQTTTIYNGGNLPLNISSIATSTPTVFTVQTASSTPCGNGIVLRPGALCEVAVTFTPSGGGSFSDSITITSNTLGAAGTAQTVALTGNGKSSLIAQAINFAQPAPVTYAPGLTITLSATGGGSGNPVVFTIAGGTGTGAISGNTLTVTTAGSFVIDANQAGNANYTAAPQVQQTAVVNQASQAINFTQPTTPITYAPSLTVTLVATGGASGNPVVFTIDGTSTGTGSISGSTLSITTPGTFVIDANQAGNANYSAAPQVQRSLVVNKAPQAINFTQPTTPVTYTPGLTIALTATGGASGNAVIFTIDSTSTASATVSGSTVTITGAGNLVIDANQAGNTDYSVAPQVQRTVVIDALPGDFSISARPASQTVNAGATANYTITVDGINAFAKNVVLSVTGYPLGSTVNFSPPQVNPGDGPATSALSVLTPPGLFAQSQPSASFWPVATPTLALLLLLPFRRWRKVWSGRLMLLVAGLASLGAVAALTGCGGGFTLNVAQTYSLTITGTSGSDVHSTTVQLTVQ
jgi:sugar lactone lactonase YvrE